MVAKFLTSTAISAATMMALVGHVAARPMTIPEPLSARATDTTPDPINLDPSTNMGGIGSTPNDDLLDWDTFYWSNGDIVAKMSCTAGKDHKMLNVARMGSDVTDLNCEDPGALIMTFKDKSAMDSAKADWQWLDGDANTMIVVADGGNCGGDLGRGEYAVTDVQYDDSALAAKMIGRSTTWTDFVDDYKLNLKSGGVETTGNFTRRIGKSGSIDLANDFSKNLFSKDIGPVNLSVDCAHCATTGSIDFDFDFSVGSGVTGSIIARNGLGASLGLGLTASGELTDAVDLGSSQLLTLPLAGINVFPFFTIGPQITAGVTSSLEPVTAAITADFGVAMVIPDGTTLRLEGGSDPINPQFNKIGPTLSASVSVGASLSPVVTFDFAATVFGVGVVAGVGLEAPKLDATLTVQATTDDAGVCGDANAAAGVELDVNVGVNVNLFAGFGSATDQPNSNSIFSTSTPVFSDCVVIA